MTRKKYAGPLPESAVTRSSCSSRSTHTVTPTARRMDSACSRMVSFTSALAYRPQAPAPTSTAVLGITRTTGRFPPEPAFEIADAHPGGDRDYQRVLVLCHCGECGGRGRQCLRFDGEYQDIGTRGNGGIVGVDLESKQLRHAIALRGIGIRENQAAAVPAAVDKAAGEGARDVAGANESDQWRVVRGGG